MLNIAAVDDDIHICSRLNEFLQDFFPVDNFRFEDYSNGEEFLRDIKSGQHYDIVFLDIEMFPCNGIETAKILREYDPDEKIFIVYVSSHTEQSFQVLDYHPYAFLEKPLVYKVFEEKMHLIVKQLNKLQVKLAIKKDRKVINLPVSSIRYIESSGRQLNIHCRKCDEVITTYDSIENIFQSLCQITPTFIRTHKSYIVNMQYIDAFSKTVVTVDGIDIPISQKYRYQSMDSFFYQNISGDNL